MRIPVLILCLLFSAISIRAQQCQLTLNGTWKDETSGDKVYSFDPNNTLTVFAGQNSAPIASGRYDLDESQPRQISFTNLTGATIFGSDKLPVTIKSYDDTSITFALPNGGKVRWIRVDPSRYFITLVARSGEFYDSSGSAFSILTRITSRETMSEAVGIYSDHGESSFGRVPALTYKDFMREPRNDSEVMLRLEINSAQYERASKVLQTWDRRVREDALLYQYQIPLNNIVLIKAVTETLNACKEDFKLYRLNYIHPEDWISDNYSPQFIPFVYFRELKKLNGPRHVTDKQFQGVYNQSAAMIDKPE
jgi:hypothetical protein